MLLESPMDKKENYEALEDHPNYSIEIDGGMKMDEKVEEINNKLDRSTYIARARKGIDDLLSLLSERDTEIEELENKFPCGHRKIDWDDSYGNCVICQTKLFNNELEEDLEEKYKKMEELIQENTRLSNEWQECHSYNNEIVAENQKLKKKVEGLEKLGPPAVPLVYCKKHKTICMPFMGKLSCCLEEQIKSLKEDYQRIIKEILLCDPIPANKRQDDRLEPPWEVVARIRERIKSQKKEIEELLEQLRESSTSVKYYTDSYVEKLKRKIEELEKKAEKLEGNIKEKSEYATKLLDESIDFYTQKCKAEKKVEELENALTNQMTAVGELKIYLNNAKAEIKSLEEGIGKLLSQYDEYIQLMTDELNDIAALAITHGWKSHRYEEGKTYRETISNLKEKLLEKK